MSFVPIEASEAPRIASESIVSQAHQGVQARRVEHRIKLVNFWQIPAGSRVLEIGCGQGDCTQVLAEAVGPTGHIDAVDPARLDYGAPWTVGQSQEHISAGPVGPRISWHKADPLAVMESTAGDGRTWDCAVLAHCVWYFSSPAQLHGILAALRGRARRVLVAEYALRASHAHAVPHVLASLARAALEAHDDASEANIRCLSSPDAIVEAAAANGWRLADQTVVVPEEDLWDGRWEVKTVESREFVREIDRQVKDPRTKAMLAAARDAVIGSMQSLGIERARTMDVWVAVFEGGLKASD